jgi:hypothetical protein
LDSLLAKGVRPDLLATPGRRSGSLAQIRMPSGANFMSAAYQANEPQGVTSLWWLCYRCSDRIEVVIIEATSITDARRRARARNLAADVPFADGHGLDAQQAALVPRDCVGRCSQVKRRWDFSTGLTAVRDRPTGVEPHFVPHSVRFPVCPPYKEHVTKKKDAWRRSHLARIMHDA